MFNLKSGDSPSTKTLFLKKEFYLIFLLKNFKICVNELFENVNFRQTIANFYKKHVLNYRDL